MKKLIFISLFFLFPFLSHAQVITINPTTYPVINEPDYDISIDIPVSGYAWIIYASPNGEVQPIGNGVSDTLWSFTNEACDNITCDPDEVFHFLLLTENEGCTGPGKTYAECQIDAEYIMEVDLTLAQAEGGEGITAIISNATTTFSSITGFEFDDVVEWSSNLIKLVLGSGIGLLSSLMPWIIAMVVIGAVVYFLYRGFRFFRH